MKGRCAGIVRRVVVVGLLALPLGAASAQHAIVESGPPIVSLFTTVTDAKGRLVPNLTREDFEILDNGKPQPIVLFDNGVQPISVIVMLDTSGSMTQSIGPMKSAAEQFLNQL